MEFDMFIPAHMVEDPIRSIVSDQTGSQEFWSVLKNQPQTCLELSWDDFLVPAVLFILSFEAWVTVEHTDVHF